MFPKLDTSDFSDSAKNNLIYIFWKEIWLMMMPSIFGENLFDDWMDFPFNDDFDKYFFGKKIRYTENMQKIWWKPM